MQVRPNKTIVEGKVCAIQPEKSGHGVEVQLEVSRNVSPKAEDDFLRPAKGDVLRLFASGAEDLTLGAHVRVHARLLAGPFGERNVLERVDPMT